MVTFTGNTFHNGKNSKRLDVFKVDAREREVNMSVPADQSQWTNPSGPIPGDVGALCGGATFHGNHLF